MARGLGARRSNELYGGLLGDYLRQAGGLLAERAGEVISGQALEEYIQSLIPGFGAYQIVDGQITFPEARAPQGGYEGLLGEMFGAGMSAPMGGLLHTVWHGSPHRWNVPDISKVGTGEGAQAYGHGFYSSESPEVAKGYANALSTDTLYVKGKPIRAKDVPGPYYEAATSIASQGFDKALKDIDDQLAFLTPSGRESALARKEQIRAIGPDVKWQKDNAHIYKLDIPDEDIARYLDWDKPLSEQAPEVQAALRKSVKSLSPNAIEDLGGDTSLLLNPDITGREILNTLESLSDIGSSTGASEFLSKAGIPGIRYLDGNSRGAGAGSYNYVTFDPSRIRVLERNGEGLLSMDPSDYGTMHRPMTVESGAATLDDLIPAFGEDVYGKNALQFFGSGDNREKRVLNILRQVRGKPDAKIKIYRGIPNGADGKINPGDWVTLDKEVAAEYGPQVIEMEVPVKDVTSWADSLLEFGYYPRKP